MAATTRFPTSSVFFKETTCKQIIRVLRLNGSGPCSLPPSSSSLLLAYRKQRSSATCRAQAEGSQVYQGIYGPWSIEPADVAEVMSYRAGLTATVAAFVAAAAITHSAGSDGAAAGGAVAVLDGLCVLGAAGLGLSLVQIHIYVTEIKRAIQALWLLGVLGGVYLAASHPEQPLPLLVAQNAWTTWLVGPAAAAVTGVAIKEGLCYGKPEAAGLAALLPLLCLVHLSGVAPAGLQDALLLAVCGVAGVFAARKYTQPIKDDIGDKSVFEFRRLSPEQQEALLVEIKQQQR